MPARAQNMTLRRLILRLRYWRSRLMRAAGYCPRCGCRGNRTPSGRLICPRCAR